MYVRDETSDEHDSFNTQLQKTTTTTMNGNIELNWR